MSNSQCAEFQTWRVGWKMGCLLILLRTDGGPCVRDKRFGTEGRCKQKLRPATSLLLDALQSVFRRAAAVARCLVVST
jgi:hypothetical protein